MPDTGITGRQDVLAKQIEEVLPFHGGHLSFIIIGLVPPTEGDLFLGDV